MECFLSLMHILALSPHKRHRRGAPPEPVRLRGTPSGPITSMSNRRPSGWVSSTLTARRLASAQKEALVARGEVAAHLFPHKSVKSLPQGAVHGSGYAEGHFGALLGTGHHHRGHHKGESRGGSQHTALQKGALVARGKNHFKSHCHRS